MRYIGNKTKLLDFIHGEIQSTCGDISNSKFCDLFSGSGSVARYFKQYCSEVIANDLEDYSYVLCRNYIGNNESFEYEELIKRVQNAINQKRLTSEKELINGKCSGARVLTCWCVS